MKSGRIIFPTGLSLCEKITGFNCNFRKDSLFTVKKKNVFCFSLPLVCDPHSCTAEFTLYSSKVVQ